MKPSFKNPYFCMLPCLFTALLSCYTAQGAALSWDTVADDGAAVTPGSGIWDTTSTTWNNGTTNVPWSQTNTTTPLDRAILGKEDAPDAAPGTHVITLNSQIASQGLKINNSGFQLTGTGSLYLRNTSTSNAFVEVADGKTLDIACPVTGPTNTALFWLAGQDAAINFTGGYGNTLQPNFIGEAGAGTQGTFNFTGTYTFAVANFNARMNITGNSTVSVSTSFFIGRGAGTGTPTTINGVSSSTGVMTLDGVDAVLNHNAGGSGNNTMIGRANGSGTLVIKNGTFNTATSNNTHDVAIPQDNDNTSKGTFDVQGGTVNVGSTGNFTAKIALGRVGLKETQSAIFTQSGGTINSFGGISFGGTAATGNYAGTAVWTMTGGSLYLGAGGIKEDTFSPSENITLSGGTIGTLTNWTGSMPMTLATTGGDITFQCANSFSDPYAIALTNSLSGTGGLQKTGTGKLTLSGVNTYTGSTRVTDGTLKIITGPTPSTTGPLTLDGAAGTPVVSINVTNVGQSYQVGNFTTTSGSQIVEMQYGVVTPSSSAAALNVAGDVSFTTMPAVTVGGTSIAIGTYPLITYTGTFSGTAPTAVVLPEYCTGTLTHNPSTKTIALVVTTSTYTPSLSWRAGDGIWDVNTTANWQVNGNPSVFQNGDGVNFDDVSSGVSPITVTLNTTVTPAIVRANSTKDYVITRSGSISSTASVNLLGTGSLTLSGMNTYAGGTTLSSGQLNLNNGGDATSSAIGTGPLTISTGAALDNTSGADVTLLTANAQQWNGNFSYTGAANSLNMGNGAVTLGNNVAVNVMANTFTTSGEISGNSGLTKTGSGTLNLTGSNTFAGGFTLAAGRLNVADLNSVGSGVLTLSAGTIDNISGAELPLLTSGILLGSSFTFAGTDNLTLIGTANLQTTNAPITIDVQAKNLTFADSLFLGNSVLTKNGSGTLTFAGNQNGSGGIVINAGRVHLEKEAGYVFTTGQNITVNNGAVLALTGASTSQIEDNTGPITLSGGIFDLNGKTERVNTITMNSNSTLRNSAAATSATLSLNGNLTLSNVCNFEATAADSALNINGVLVGAGQFRKIGAGSVTLTRVNTYTGATNVQAGTLAVTGALGNTAVTVNSAATLAGNGNLGGSLTIQSGGRHALSVAASPAEQTTRIITGTLALADGNILYLSAAAPPLAAPTCSPPPPPSRAAPPP